MSLASSLAEALRDRYALERELGRGGMATVYLARDLRHDRQVALKVLPPDLAATLGPERFLREIRTAARLQHPHILSVHDSGEAGNRLWFTMPYVEGESLRDRLRREHQLSIDDAVQIAREAAQALNYAHEHGVIHRDIKPENILLTRDGNVLVADFGIARALGAEEQLTQTGLTVGTPAYMSPEQAAGDRSLDARSDIYSLGCVLYEMLAGEPPFTGPTAQAIIAKRFSAAVTAVRILRPDAPEHIEQALTTALARTPASRFASMSDFARAIKPAATTPASTPTAVTPSSAAFSPPPGARRGVGAAAFAIGLLLLAGAAWVLVGRRATARPAAATNPAPTAPTTAAGVTRLAVLPFENLGDTADAYFADGVSDEVRGKLATLPGLEIIARTSSSQYRTTTKPPQQIARELGVRYLLTGTVRWEKPPRGTSRVRVSPELVDAQSGADKWQAPFDAALTDVFQVQGEIAGRVAEALNVALGAKEEQALAARPTQSLAAYDAFLRGDQATRRFTTNDVAGLRRGLAYYDRAVKLDSTFALAWTRVSRVHGVLYYVSSSDPADSAAAEQASRRALALAPNLPDTRLALGDYYYRAVGDNARALEQYKIGRQLAPNDANLIGASAIAEQGLSRWQEAAADAREAFRLDPRSIRSASRLARTLIFLRHYDEALAAADAGVRLDPASPDAVWMKVLVHVAEGDLEAARAVYRNTPPELDRRTLVAYVAHYWELAWTLDRQDLDLLAGLSPEPFGGGRADWGLALAQAWTLKGDTTRARTYADTARVALERQVAASPRNDAAFGLLGLSLAYLGHYDEAIAAAKRSLALRGPAADPYSGGYNQLQLARIYAMAGQRARALDAVETLLRIPLFVTPGWLRIDPTFASLRGNPRFERLVAPRQR